jgi:hypothetical protein
MSAYNFVWRLAKEPGAGGIYARDNSIHVPRVDDVGCLLDNLSIMLLYTAPLGEPGNLYQQFLITKRECEVIVRSRRQTLDAMVRRIPESTNQEHRDVSCPGFLFDLATKLNTVKDRHHHIANHHIGPKGIYRFEAAAAVSGSHDFVAFVFYEFGKERSNILIVIDDQHSTLF